MRGRGRGFLLMYVPKDKQDKVRAALSDYRELPFMLDSFGSRIIFNVRSYQQSRIAFSIRANICF